MVKVYWKKMESSEYVYLYFRIPFKTILISSLRIFKKKNIKHRNKRGSERGWLIQNFYKSSGIRVESIISLEQYDKSFKLGTNDIFERWKELDSFGSGSFPNPKEILIRELKNEGTRKS